MTNQSRADREFNYSVKHIEFVNMRAYWAIQEDGGTRHLRQISTYEGESAKKKWSKSNFRNGESRLFHANLCQV